MPSPSSPFFLSRTDFLYRMSTNPPLYRPSSRSQIFYVFGNPIAESMSPTLHNTAFTTLGLPHSYALLGTFSVDPLVEVLQNPSFGGASVQKRYHALPHARLTPGEDHWSGQYCYSNSGRLFGGQYGLTSNQGLYLEVCHTSQHCHCFDYSTRYWCQWALYYIGVFNIFIYNRTKTNAQTNSTSWIRYFAFEFSTRFQSHYLYIPSRR